MNTITVLVTGSSGFIGKHLMEALSRKPNVRALAYDITDTPQELAQALREAQIIYHLAGINRPQNIKEYQSGNVGFTQTLCAALENLGRRPTIVLSSSIQAEFDTPYGISKREAEQVLLNWTRRTGSSCVIFRLKNVFGKWCRPNYNSVVATFCHNIAHNLEIAISDKEKELDLVYIDDVIAAFLDVLDHKAGGGTQKPEGGCDFREIPRSFRVTLGALADTIHSFQDSRKTLQLPAFANDFNRCLYATYLSYRDGSDLAYNLDIKTDDRGSLAEFMKSPAFGQLFVSRTRPGITRGNHYHHTKTEKFMVVQGEGLIRLRSITPQDEAPTTQGKEDKTREIVEYRVSANDFRVVDIPPGYTHSIENVGTTEMVVLFWASEIFDPRKPDTISIPVLQPSKTQSNVGAGMK